MSKRIDTEVVTTLPQVIEILDAMFHQMPDESIHILIEKEPSIGSYFTDCSDGE